VSLDTLGFGCVRCRLMTGGDTFGGRLAAAMSAKGMSPDHNMSRACTELAIACGGAFSWRSVARWLDGESCPGVEVVPLLCVALGVSADYLCCVEGSGDA
jgi:hypothetical protein